MTPFLRKTLIATGVAAAMIVTGASFAQTPPAHPPVPAADKAAADAKTAEMNKAIDAKFKNEKEKFGYLVGIKVGENLAQIKDEVDTDALVAALRDSLKGVKPKLTPEELNQVNQELMQKHQASMLAKRAEEAKKNQTDGDAFLAKNKTKPGVKTTESGLQYEVIKEGTGPKPKATDTVKVEYVGTKIDGTQFDASADHGGSATFPLNNVIPGWTEGVQLMATGAKYKFYVPAKLGYGDNGPGKIGPNAVLIFEVTLLGIEPPAAEAPPAKQ
jgi:FKBP-type peptidyl-prolyl cis-trans isomerase